MGNVVLVDGRKEGDIIMYVNESYNDFYNNSCDKCENKSFCKNVKDMEKLKSEMGKLLFGTALPVVGHIECKNFKKKQNNISGGWNFRGENGC